MHLVIVIGVTAYLNPIVNKIKSAGKMKGGECWKCVSWKEENPPPSWRPQAPSITLGSAHTLADFVAQDWSTCIVSFHMQLSKDLLLR
jgi:hypothetical protein